MLKNEETTLLEEKKDILNKASMKIILHAGDARLLIMEALDDVADKKIADAEEKLKKAHKEIKLGHKAQTEIVQKDVSGDPYPHSLLFSHAQDTLMTIYSEYNITTKIIKIMKNM